MANVDPDEAREQAEHILDNRRYRAGDPPRPLRGPLSWIGDRLESVARAIDRILPGNMLWLAWAIIALAVLGVIALIVRAVIMRRRAPKDGRDRGGALIGTRDDDPAALERAADEAEARGDLELALRLRFRAGLLRLDRRGVIVWRPSITTTEVRTRVDSRRFDDLATTFEEVAYGGRPPSTPDLDDARTGWRDVLQTAGKS